MTKKIESPTQDAARFPRIDEPIQFEGSFRPIKGQQKTVYKTKTLNGIALATKIYYAIDPTLHSPINQALLAREEYRAYEILRESPYLAPLIPKPHSIVHQNQIVTGLNVEWRDKPITSLYLRHYFTQADFSGLQRSMMLFSGAEYPSEEMLSESNLGYNEITKLFWFTSCSIDTRPIRRSVYEAYINQAIDRLARKYAT